MSGNELICGLGDGNIIIKDIVTGEDVQNYWTDVGEISGLFAFDIKDKK